MKAPDQPGNVDLADHHPTEHHELRYRRANAGKIRAEQTPVERRGHNSSAGNRRPGHVAAIVRMLAARKKLHIGAGAQIVDHLWPARQKCGSQLTVGRLPDQRIEITIRLFGAIVQAVSTALALSRYPKRATRR